MESGNAKNASKKEPGWFKAAALAVLVHLVFVGLLIFGFNWKEQPPEGMIVELWQDAPKQAVPQPPAVKNTPPPAPPQQPPKPAPEPKVEPKPAPVKPQPAPPPPKQPDIALKEKEAKAKEEAERLQREQETQKRREEEAQRKRQEEEQKRREQEDQRKRQEAEQKQQEQREREAQQKREQEAQKRREQEAQRKHEQEEKARIEAQQAAAAAAARAQVVSEIGKYKAMIMAKIKSRIVMPPDLPGNPFAEFNVTLLPGGDILDVRLRKSSGYPSFDSAVERAIHLSKPLPLPPDPALFGEFRNLNVIVHYLE